MITIVVAVAENGVIGKDNSIPWDYPEDLRWFKTFTTGKTLVMGRKTFDSLPEKFKPLPNRRTIVLTKDQSKVTDKFERVVNPITLEESELLFVSDVKEIPDDVLVVGGEQIYRLMIDRVDQIILSRIPLAPVGDTFFPFWPVESFGWKSHGILSRTGNFSREILRRSS